MGRLARYDITKVSDKRPFMRRHEISQFLQQKGFCIMKSEIDPNTREFAVAEAEALKQAGTFMRPPKEVQCGMFGSSGSAWVKESQQEKDKPVPNEIKNLWAIESDIRSLGEDLAQSSAAYYDMAIEGSSAARIHRSKSREDGTNPPLAKPDEAEYYLSLFMLKRLKLVYYMGPAFANLFLMPIEAESQAESEVFSTQIQPGTLLIMRTDVCRCVIETRASDLGLTMEMDFIAVTGHTDLVPPPPELDQWFIDRYQAIVENDVVENVPEGWQKSARQVFHKSVPIRIMTLHSDMPTVIFSPGNNCPFEASVLAGNDCIGGVPEFKWDINAYYDEDPEMTDDFKMYTKHMGYVDRGHPPEEDFDIADFGLTKAEAEEVDRRHLMLCESSCLCLQSADMSKEDTEGEDFGVFCGLSGGDMYYALMSREKKFSKCSVIGTAGIVNRISYMFGSIGPSLAVDTEDSSGSAAADTAVTYLRNGKCGHQALLGAANHIPHPFSVIILCASGLITTTGRSRVFDQASDGFIRSEGVVTMLLELHRRDEDLPAIKGMLTGSAVNSKGTSSSLTAPNSAAIGDILSRAQKDSGCPAAVLDAVEVHATGRPLADAMEYGKMKNVLVSKETNPCCAVLRNAASTLGSIGAPGGLVSVARALMQFEKAMHGPCIHLHQLFEIGATAAEDGLGAGRLHIPLEAMELRSTTSVVGVTSFGGSGTNVHHVLSGQRKLPERRSKVGKQLAFFPSNQRLPETNPPKEGYFICGTWNAYEKSQKMEVESEGVYGYTVTLGENGWESFVIYVDDDFTKVLYPEYPWSAKDAKVCGPAVHGRESVWLIDGRGLKVVMINEEQSKALEKQQQDALKAGRVPKDPEFQLKVAFAADEKPAGFEQARGYLEMPLVEMNKEDVGAPGDKYRVRLYTQGNFKRVSWGKLPLDSPLSLPSLEEEPYLHQYYVVGDHNYWTFDVMSGTNEFSLECHLLQDNSTFQIVRDKDWDQTFFPKWPELTSSKTPSEGADIEGPSMNGLLKKWTISNKKGDIYKITFSREKRSVSWTYVSNRAPNLEEITRDHKYCLLGSFSDFRNPIDMEYDQAEKKWIGGFTAKSGKDTFSIMLQRNYLAVVHPKDDEGHWTDDDGRCYGPSDDGHSKRWKLAKAKDAIKGGDEVLVEMTMQDGLPSTIKWTKGAMPQAEGDFAG